MNQYNENNEHDCEDYFFYYQREVSFQVSNLKEVKLKKFFNYDDIKSYKDKFTIDGCEFVCQVNDTNDFRILVDSELDESKIVDSIMKFMEIELAEKLDLYPKIDYNINNLVIKEEQDIIWFL